MTTDDIKSITEWITTKDGTAIFTRTWKPPSSTPTIANLVLIHGFGEHIGRYDRLLSNFARQGIESYGYDQRGWGETGKKSTQYGNNQGYNTALRDIDDAILKIKQQNRLIPIFLMGHSMGGGLILNYLAKSDIYEGVSFLSGAIASSPLITLSMPISSVKYYTLRTLSNIVPSVTIRAGVDPAGISHDKEEVEKYKKDPLVHDYATLATLRSFIDAGQNMIDKPLANLIKIPILYSHADTDPINAFNGTSEAYKLTLSQDKELKNWAGLYHELHNEIMPQRQQITEYYINWMKKHLL
ncbi:Alpha/Beta hydrolase protein [Cokeromyces recurvatus]|uniref:Alpha/Beta hydrolase protein n=1 Tax=Cokeromyces recurvatus TaxID=90255 RepID=UPI0022207B17|nr:Alpha/Beta hydrolase protein [Cokeromyces recurvatus]KAI7898951.1 Alpha/Beta hydrolase protein [Cokeromyces recurvatus]